MLYILVYIFICTLTIVIRSSALFVGFYICLVKRVFMFLTFWLQILRGLALSGGSRISWVWLSYQGTVLSAGPKPQMYTGINMEIGFKKNGTILSHLKIETGIIKKWFVYPFQDRPFQKLDVYTVSDFLLVIWNISYGMLTVLRFSGWAPQSPDSCPYWPMRQFQIFWDKYSPLYWKGDPVFPSRPSRRAFVENRPSNARIFVILPVYLWFWARSERY